MSPTQAQTQPETAQATMTPQLSILDTIVENTDARKQAEAARADKMTADIYSSNQSAYCIAMGRELGLNAANSLQLIHIIGGKPALSAGARALFLKKSGYSWGFVAHTDDVCTLRFSFGGETMLGFDGKPVDVSYTVKDAAKAGYIKDGGGWSKTPKNMLFARCISNFHRWHAPEVVGVGLYDVGEAPKMDDIISTTEARTRDAVTELRERLTTEKEVAA